MSANKKGQLDSAKVVIREVFSRFCFRIPDYVLWGQDVSRLATYPAPRSAGCVPTARDTATGDC